MCDHGRNRHISKTCCLWILFVLLSLVRADAHTQTSACMAADLRISFHLHDDTDGVERITLLTRNISGHDCLLTASYPPNFVPAQQPNGPRIELCQQCANRLHGEDLEKLSLLLPHGAVAHRVLAIGLRAVAMHRAA